MRAPRWLRRLSVLSRSCNLWVWALRWHLCWQCRGCLRLSLPSGLSLLPLYQNKWTDLKKKKERKKEKGSISKGLMGHNQAEQNMYYESHKKECGCWKVWRNAKKSPNIRKISMKLKISLNSNQDKSLTPIYTDIYHKPTVKRHKKERSYLQGWRERQLVIYKCTSSSSFFFNVYRAERQSMSREGAERGKHRIWSTSRLQTVITEPNVRLAFKNHEIVTWAEFGFSVNWVTQAPHRCTTVKVFIECSTETM